MIDSDKMLQDSSPRFHLCLLKKSVKKDLWLGAVFLQSKILVSERRQRRGFQIWKANNTRSPGMKTQELSKSLYSNALVTAWPDGSFLTARLTEIRVTACEILHVLAAIDIWLSALRAQYERPAVIIPSAS